ncbi:MAG: efflux RND transporter permease subunit, partial [Planctomycetia bacterium]|nr:efflux RND transporter permease subunit [Planctomycetia bacterium]
MKFSENSHFLNPAFLCLKYKTITLVLMVLTVVYGIYAFYHLGRLSYPDFTIKKAMIVTHFPGASPEEVEELVTDVIEEAIQSISEIWEITSQSQAGVSYVTVEMLPTVRKGELPQVWDFLRKKMRDIQGKLPYGCARPIVNDSFGDVYGIYYALTCSKEFASGKSQAQQLNWLKDQGRWLKKELLNIREVRDIARIDFYGVQKEVIHLEIPQSKLATQGIVPRRIMQELENQSLILDAGSVRIGNDFVRISPTGEFTTLESILNIVVSDSSGESVITLGDLVEREHLQRENQDPPTTLFRFNGRPAVAMGLSAKKDGNIVFMGKDIHEMLEELKATQWPDGLEVNAISDQAQEVTLTVNAFSVNLYKSIGIVMLLLFIFMGWQCGLILGFMLMLTILGTFIGMYFCGIPLQIISLGALILALGMMADNGIVILEEIIILRRRGFSRQLAAIKAVEKCQFPLLGATAIAILAFAAVGFMPDNIGEFCASLFQVVALALAISWLTAVTILPLLCVYFLPERRRNWNAETTKILETSETPETSDISGMSGNLAHSAFMLSHVLPFFPFQWLSLILPVWPFHFRVSFQKISRFSKFSGF